MLEVCINDSSKEYTQDSQYHVILFCFWKLGLCFQWEESSNDPQIPHKAQWYCSYLDIYFIYILLELALKSLFHSLLENLRVGIQDHMNLIDTHSSSK